MTRNRIVNSPSPENLHAELSAYLDGELSPERAREVDELLAHSDSARRLFEDLRVISRGLAELPRHAAPEGIAEQVLQRATGISLAADLRARRRLLLVQVISRSMASAAVVVLCVIGGWVMLVKDAPPIGRNAPAESIDASPGRKLPLRNAPSPTDAGERVGGGSDLSRTAGLANEGEPARDAATAIRAPGDAAPVGGSALAHKSLGGPLAARDSAGRAPDLEIVVQADSTRQYRALQDVIGSWQATGRLAYHIAPEPHDAQRLVPDGRPTEQLVQVSVAQVSTFLDELGQGALENMQVGMNFRGGDLTRVQRMLGANDAHDPAIPDRADLASDPPTSPELAAREIVADKSDAGDFDRTRSPAERDASAYLARAAAPASRPQANSNTPPTPAESTAADQAAPDRPVAAEGVGGRAAKSADEGAQRLKQVLDDEHPALAEASKKSRPRPRIVAEKRPAVAGMEQPISGELRTPFEPTASFGIALGMDREARRSLWRTMMSRADEYLQPILRELQPMARSLARVPAGVQSAATDSPVFIRVQVLPPPGEAVDEPAARESGEAD